MCVCVCVCVCDCWQQLRTALALAHHMKYITIELDIIVDKIIEQLIKLHQLDHKLN